MHIPPKLCYREFEVTMDKGLVVTFLPITPEHKQLILDGFHQLSAASKYMRFGHPVNELSNKELDYLTQVDQQYHVAWGATVSREGKKCGIAVGRYVHSVENVGNVEFALTVLDEYQNHGIGRYMLALLYCLAIKQGVHTLSGSILPTNGHAAEIMQSLGAHISVDYGLYYANLPIMTDWTILTSAYAKRFSETLDYISLQLRPCNS